MYLKTRIKNILGCLSMRSWIIITGLTFNVILFSLPDSFFQVEIHDDIDSISTNELTVNNQNQPSANTQNQPSANIQNQPSANTQNQPIVNTQNQPSANTQNQPTVSSKEETTTEQQAQDKPLEPVYSYNFKAFKKITILPECSCRPFVEVTRYENLLDKDDILYETKNMFFHFANLNEKEGREKLNFLQSVKPETIKTAHLNPKFTCSLDRAINPGPGQRVISFSLFDTNLISVSHLENLIESAKKIYPDWLIRFYHNKDLNSSLICELECKFKEISFCNVNEIPFKSDEFIDLFSKYLIHGIFSPESKIVNDLSYVTGGMWKWFPIADDFVEHFISRSLDNSFIQRDKDAVDDWINSKKSFHIIRDSPLHNYTIIGDLWGHSKDPNRNLGQLIYKKLVDQEVQKTFGGLLSNNSMNEIENLFLKENVWELAANNSKIHDSYSCQSLGGEPFPSKRPSNVNCFVGCKNNCCDQNQNTTSTILPVCPESCRPKDHSDWEFC